MSRREFWVVLVLAFLATGVASLLPNMIVPYGEYGRFGLPFPFFETYTSIRTVTITETFNFTNLILDFLVLLLTIVSGCLIIKWIRQKRSKAR